MEKEKVQRGSRRGGFRFSHHGQQQGPRAHIRQAAAGAAVHHAERPGRELGVRRRRALLYRRPADGLVSLWGIEEEALLRRFSYACGVGPASDRLLGGVARGAETFGGPELKLTDNENFCVFARFCDAGGRVWNLVGISDDADAKTLAVREANMCPGGRLSAWENRTGSRMNPITHRRWG